MYKILNLLVSRIRYLLVPMVLFAFFDTTYASVIPGTIKKGSHSFAITCNEKNSPTYEPTNAGGSCVPSTTNCKDLRRETYVCGTEPCKVADSCGVLVDSTCNVTCERDVCYEYYAYPIFNPSGKSIFKDYSKKIGELSFGSAPYSVILGQDRPEVCSNWADGTLHTPAILKSVELVCTGGSESSNEYRGGSSGMCNKFGSKDNLVTSFDQLGAISRVLKPEESNATCIVEGRYATADNSGPGISVSGLGVFDGGDQDTWCNIIKYRKGEKTAGCEYYAARAGVAYGDDLLQGLSIGVDDPDSGVLSVAVDLGTCSASWDHTSTLGSRIDDLDMPTLLVSTISPSGVKSQFKTLTVTHGDLLSKFGVARLDSCLSEGKNFLHVSALDQARSNEDGVSLASNPSEADYGSSNGYIKIDNYSPKIGLGGDMVSFADSNTPADCFVGSASLTPVGTDWKNFTLNGSIRSTDPFGENKRDCSVIINPSVGGASCGSSPGVCKSGVRVALTTRSDGVDWSCKVNISGIDRVIPCSYYTPPECGSANGVAVSTSPTSGLCNFGSPINFSGTGPWSWKCKATKEDINCTAPILGGPLPTCTDGIQNGTETGIDCGGGCGACPTSTTGPYAYGDWGLCSVSCGGGTQTRTESCAFDICHTRQTTSQTCNPSLCPRVYAQCIQSPECHGATTSHNQCIGWDNTNSKFSHATFYTPDGGSTWDITGVTRIGSQGIGSFSTAPDGDPDKVLVGISGRTNGDQSYGGFYCKSGTSTADIKAFMDANMSNFDIAHRFVLQPYSGFLVPVQYSSNGGSWGGVTSSSGWPMFFFAQENGGFLEYENDYYVASDM